MFDSKFRVLVFYTIKLYVPGYHRDLMPYKNMHILLRVIVSFVLFRRMEIGVYTSTGGVLVILTLKKFKAALLLHP